LTSHGIQLFYTIDGGASPAMAWLTSYITEQFIDKLRGLGADYNAKDVSRVMRVPDSVNEKTGQKVEWEIWNNAPYTLKELQSYCEPLKKFNKKVNRQTEIVYTKTFDKKLGQFYRTNNARLKDLRTLFTLRNGDFTNCRNVFIYIYAYQQSLMLDSQEGVLGKVKNDLSDIDSRTDKKMTKAELERTIRSAYKDCQQFFEDYMRNGYRMVNGHNDGIKKPYKTDNLIKKLGITPEEEYEMSSIRSEKVAKKQHNAYMKQKRRSDGVKSRDEYRSSKQRETAEMGRKLADLIANNPRATKTELAELMGVTRPTLYKYYKARPD
jgi:hypothetical protein